MSPRRFPRIGREWLLPEARFNDDGSENSALLQENGDDLLQENGDRLLLEAGNG